jgi:hypothetical protein
MSAIARSQRGSTLLEFALAWPVVVILVLGSVQLGVWAAEAHAVRAAALAGAESGSTRSGTEEGAAEVAVSTLRTSLVGAGAARWCPEAAGPPPAPVWVCASTTSLEARLRIGGAVPALVPTVFASGLPVGADVRLQREVFSP